MKQEIIGKLEALKSSLASLKENSSLLKPTQSPKKSIETQPIVLPQNGLRRFEAP